MKINQLVRWDDGSWSGTGHIKGFWGINPWYAGYKNHLAYARQYKIDSKRVKEYELDIDNGKAWCVVKKKYCKKISKII